MSTCSTSKPVPAAVRLWLPLAVAGGFVAVVWAVRQPPRPERLDLAELTTLSAARAAELAPSVSPP